MEFLTIFVTHFLTKEKHRELYIHNRTANPYLNERLFSRPRFDLPDDLHGCMQHAQALILS